MSGIALNITIGDVLATAKSAIRNYAALDTFCQSHYQRTLRIFVGLDRVNPPAESNCPFLVITPSTTPYDTGEAPAGNQRSITFEVYWGIKEKSETASDSGNTITQDGLTNVDALGNLILAALQAGFENLLHAEYLLYPEEPPLFEGAMSCTVVEWVGLASEPSLS